MDSQDAVFHSLAAITDRKNSNIRNEETIVKTAEIENRSLTAEERKDFDGLMQKAEDLAGDVSRIQNLGGQDTRSHREVALLEQDRALVHAQRNPSPRMAEVMGGWDEGRQQHIESKIYDPSEKIMQRPSGLSLQKWFRGMVTGRWEGAEM